MTAPTPSRTALADLIPLIERANLSPTQKRDQISAVRTVARLLDARLEEVDADPARLRRRLETIAAPAAGLSRGRWNNIRSLLGKALALARPVLPGRRTTPLLPEWVALLTPLSRNRASHLLAMARYLSASGVTPDAVTLLISRPIARRSSATDCEPSPSKPGTRSYGAGMLPTRNLQMAGVRDPARYASRGLRSALDGLSAVLEDGCRRIPSSIWRARTSARTARRDPHGRRRWKQGNDNCAWRRRRLSSKGSIPARSAPSPT